MIVDWFFSIINHQSKRCHIFFHHFLHRNKMLQGFCGRTTGIGDKQEIDIIGNKNIRVHDVVSNTGISDNVYYSCLDSISVVLATWHDLCI